MSGGFSMRNGHEAAEDREMFVRRLEQEAGADQSVEARHPVREAAFLHERGQRYVAEPDGATGRNFSQRRSGSGLRLRFFSGGRCN